MFNNNGKEIFALIDSNALIHRAFHAYPPTLATTSGEQVNAVFGFSQMLLRVFEEIKPTYIACAFDLRKPTFRHLEYVGYKASRPKMDAGLVPQFDRVKEVVHAFNIPVFEVEGYEADDVIGTLCRQIDELDPQNQVNTIIVTGDKDALQLIDANTKVWLPGKTFKDMQLYGIEEVKKRFGLKPKQIIDLKALAGDPSDEIPGVNGIGDKGAMTLLSEFESVEDIYNNLDKVATRYRKKLEEDHESAVMSKRLATIVTEVPIKLSYEDSVLSDYDYDEVYELFQKLQFRSLINKLPKSSRKKEDREQFGLFSSEDSSPVEKKKIDVSIDNNEELNILQKEITQNKSFAYFIYQNENSLYLGICTKEKSNFCFTKDFIKKEENLKIFKHLFENKSIVKIGYKIKGDIHVLRNLGIGMDGDIFDVCLAAYLLGYQGGNLELQSLAFSLIGEYWEEEKFLKSSEYSELVSLASTSLLNLYSILKIKLKEQDEDAGLVWKKLIKGDFEKLLALPDYKIGVKDLFEKVETPLVRILAEMEENGILVDGEQLEALKIKFNKEISKLEREIYDIVGHEFNIASSRQLADVLFEELHLPAVKRLKTGYSTASSVLTELRSIHPVIEPIENYRELTKLVSTYVEGLIPLIKEDGKIHTSYNQTIAVTGRLSSSNPNLQNIPVRTDLGNEIRRAFVASENSIFISIDYSQIELRLAAHVAGEEKMLEAFKKNLDVHAATASEIFDVPIEKVKKAQRRIAKTVNFAVLYGVSPYGLAQQLETTPEEANVIIERYFNEYPQIHNYIDKVISIAKENGYLESMFGRKSIVKDINSKNFQARKAAERFSINFPMQGSASDIMKISMIEAKRKLDKFLLENKNLDVKILLQIHDELVFEYKEIGKSRDDLFQDGKIKSKLLRTFVKEIKDAMENVIELTIPLKTGVEIGVNLADLEELEV